MPTCVSSGNAEQGAGRGADVRGRQRGPGGGLAAHADPPGLISLKVFVKLFCKSEFPHKSVNLLCISVKGKDELTILWGS